MTSVPGQSFTWADLQEVFLALSETFGKFEIGNLGFDVYEKKMEPAWLALGTVTHGFAEGGGNVTVL